MLAKELLQIRPEEPSRSYGPNFTKDDFDSALVVLLAIMQEQNSDKHIEFIMRTLRSKDALPTESPLVLDDASSHSSSVGGQSAAPAPASSAACGEHFADNYCDAACYLFGDDLGCPYKIIG